MNIQETVESRRAAVRDPWIYRTNEIRLLIMGIVFPFSDYAGLIRLLMLTKLKTLECQFSFESYTSRSS
jgi:hypothetical protein